MSGKTLPTLGRLSTVRKPLGRSTLKTKKASSLALGPLEVFTASHKNRLTYAVIVDRRKMGCPSNRQADTRFSKNPVFSTFLGGSLNRIRSYLKLNFFPITILLLSKVVKRSPRALIIFITFQSVIVLKNPQNTVRGREKYE